jgi:3-deoxy-D-manno-octulosonic-acid transferase
MTTLLLFTYNFLLFILIIILSIPAFVFSKRFRSEVKYHLGERFALCKPLIKGEKKVIWFHCASLGEVRAIEPILDKLKDEFLIALTVVTKSGCQYVAKIKGLALVSLFPLDIYPFMIKAFKRIDPDIFVLVETELWASMLYAAHKRKVKIAVVNARMSDKTYKIYHALRFFWKRFIGLINVILARSKEDGDRFSLFAKNNMDVIVTGNIKYDRDFSLGAARGKMGFKESDLIFTAGSTREGEEEIIVEVYKNISLKYPNIKFFLAPRHITRIEEISRMLNALRVPYNLFSQKQYKNNFILVDVFGKLQDIYSISDICFVGGSMVNKGGQNPIEPAAYAKPVIFGKYMSNFKTEAEILLSYGGAVEVSNVNVLKKEILSLLSDEERLKSMGQQALYAVKSQRGAVSITIEKIKGIINES